MATTAEHAAEDSVSGPAQARGYPDDLSKQVDERLATLRFGNMPEVAGLEEAMRYSLLAGGKRIRPVLALCVADALGRAHEEVIAYALALELVHTYSLIHDDLPAMDDDDMRRGRPTCHVAFGENVAILAGDALFAEALALALSATTPPAASVAGVRELLEATGAGGMVGGQYIDVAGSVGGESQLRLMHSLKTGRLIVASVRGAALVLEAPAGLVDRLTGFAAELGVLFQIVDDILDVTGEDAELGKPSGSDERHGKATYVSVHGLAEARELARQSHQRASELLEATDLPGDAGRLLAVTDFIFERER
jgi:geranylgeranyl diphosphate synthase type II